MMIFKIHTACCFNNLNLNWLHSKLKLLQVVNHDRNGENASICNFTCTSVCSKVDLFTSFAKVTIRILLILSSLETRVDAFDDQQTKAQIYSVTRRAHTHTPSLHHDVHTGASRIGDNSNFNLRADNSNDTKDVVCHPAGRCEPCPRDEVRKALPSCFYYWH